MDVHLRHLPAPVRRLVHDRLLEDPVLSDGHEDCPIPWQPSVFAPVFHGYRDLEVFLPDEPVVATARTAASAVGAERPPFDRPGTDVRLRVFFPTVDGSPQHASIQRGCHPFPLVLLAHGHCAEERHWQKWWELPATLARSGYVVLLPELPRTAAGTAPSGNTFEQQLVHRLVRWARSGWEHRDRLMPAPATALVGHSFGGGLTAHVAASAPWQYAAHAALSAVEYDAGLARSSMPKLLTWGTEPGLEVLTVPFGRWREQFSGPTHVVEVHGGGHWDYLPAGRSGCEGDPGRGPCHLVPHLAGDVVACFLTRYLRPDGVPQTPWPWPLSAWLPEPHAIHPSLRRPPLVLTQQQEFFAGGHLTAWNGLGTAECGLTMSWQLPGSSGSLVPA